MRTTITGLLLAAITTIAANAQNAVVANPATNKSYVSVMSKAGAPVPRPPVPNRNVPVPAGAQAGYNYYYGFYRAGYGNGSYASPGFDGRERPTQPSEGTLPGYDTKPNSSTRSRTSPLDARGR